MIIKNILCGPFIGDFRTEIIDFRPLTRWIYEVLKPEKMFVSTHSNRCFLYDWATTIPVFEDLSRDELNQNGALHNSISQKDLTIITKKIKSDVSKLLKPKEDFVHINFAYTKNSHWYPLYKKIYTSVKYNISDKKSILFIPNISEKYAVTKEIHDFLCKNFDNVIVAGDMKTHLHENNIMFKNPTYFTDIYKDMVDQISNASVVITPNSHWTILSQIQNKPVFSWGSLPVYCDNNKKNNMILTDDVPLNNIKNMMFSFIKKYK
jgi:hypothetical protein